MCVFWYLSGSDGSFNLSHRAPSSTIKADWGVRWERQCVCAAVRWRGTFKRQFLVVFMASTVLSKRSAEWVCVFLVSWGCNRGAHWGRKSPCCIRLLLMMVIKGPVVPLSRQLRKQISLLLFFFFFYYIRAGVKTDDIQVSVSVAHRIRREMLAHECRSDLLFGRNSVVWTSVFPWSAPYMCVIKS